MTSSNDGTDVTESGGGPERSRLRRWLGWFGRPVVIVWSLTLVLLLGLYFDNTNEAWKKKGEIGDGKYHPLLARGDGHPTYLMLRSIVMDGDVHFDNDLARFGDVWNQPRNPKTKRKSIFNQVGPAIAWLPLMSLANDAAHVGNMFGADIPTHGYTMFHQRIVFLSGPLFIFGVGLFGFFVARRYVGGTWAPLYAGVAGILGTNAVYYGTYMPAYGHATDAFFTAAFLGYWALTLSDWRYRRFVILGALLGMCAMIRVSGATLGVVVFFEILAEGTRILRRGEGGFGRRLDEAFAITTRGFVAIAVAILAFWPQMHVWYLNYGEYITSPAGENYVQFSRMSLLEFLFSSRNGWLSLHPIAYLGIVGLFFVPRRARFVAVCLLVVVALQAMLNASAWDWWSQASWGQRRMCQMTIVVIIGLAGLLRFGAVVAAKVRLPWPITHAACVIGLGWLLAWNFSILQQLEHGALGPGRNFPYRTCCRNLSKNMKNVAQPIYDEIGNPFAFPASAYYTLKYGIKLNQWDLAVGNYADKVPLREFNKKQHLRKKYHWNIPGANFHFLIKGLGPRQHSVKKKRNFRWTTENEAEFLVNLFFDGGRKVGMWVRPNMPDGAQKMPVTMGFNGKTHYQGELRTGWQNIRMEVPEGHVWMGTNTFWIKAKRFPYVPKKLQQAADPVPPHPWGYDVGIAVSQMDLSFIRKPKATPKRKKRPRQWPRLPTGLPRGSGGPTL